LDIDRGSRYVSALILPFDSFKLFLWTSDDDLAFESRNFYSDCDTTFDDSNFNFFPSTFFFASYPSLEAKSKCIDLYFCRDLHFASSNCESSFAFFKWLKFQQEFFDSFHFFWSFLCSDRSFCT